MSDTHIFLKLPGLSGEASAASHREEIELESISWGLRSKSKGGKSEASGGRPQMQLGEVSISKHFDLSSPGIMKRIGLQKRKLQGRNRPAFLRMSIVYADVVPNKSGDNHLVPVLEYVLHECFVESMSLSASGGKTVAVTEEITIAFMKIEVTYHPPSAERSNRSRGIQFTSTAAGTKQ
jgi:type VI protein secretion system component Hcp